MLSLSIYVLK